LIVQAKYDGQVYDIDMDRGIDLSIENNFSGNAPIFYGSEQPKAVAQQLGDFIGDLKSGGSCNVPIVSCNIHCTGTHTECISHILDSKVRVPDKCPTGLIPADVITVQPESSDSIEDLYHCDISGQLVISKRSIKQKISKPHQALIIRTLPNDRSKLTRNYDDDPAPFFTNDAIDYISEVGVKHLLVDTPSIDKSDDGGMLGNHRSFFKKGDTISELLFIPDGIMDGFGFLQIHIPSWSLDSAPSRPIFFPI